MITPIETEIRINAQWQLDPAYRGRRIHEELLRHEFMPREELAAQQAFTLRRQMEHCYDTVPYYQEVFAKLGIRRRYLRDPAILQQLPVLTKADVIANLEALQSRHLPSGNEFSGYRQTSGTTGEPLSIPHSARSFGLFRWLKQREYRWFRFDPAGVMLQIRPPMDLPRPGSNQLLGRDEVLQLPRWALMENLFVTGRMWGYSSINSEQSQRDLVNKVLPDYLLIQASCLEHLSLQKFSEAARERLRGALSISQTLTPNMRALIEANLKIPVQQDYGLNEIGLVASQCQEGGNYHVHVENSLVELIDESGRPVAPGNRGKLIVTSLSNYALPLLRYDADDLALAVDQTCACGKSLPAFGAVQGRYRRSAFLPAGTMQRWGAIQGAIYRAGLNRQSTVRKYQACQNSAGDFELRVDCDEEVFAQLSEAVHAAFGRVRSQQTGSPQLSIVRTQQFVNSTGNKFQDFISSHTPEMDL